MCETRARRGGGWVLAAVAGCLVAVLAAPAARAGTWTTQVPASPAGAEHGYLYEVACEPSTASVCTAVGKKTTSGVSTPLGELWNGSSWSVQSAATPAGATESELRSNYCASSTSCLAVGSYASAAGRFALAEVWNGREWALQSAANPAGATETRLNGVSCSATSACTAAGYAVVASVRSAIAERWNGSTWSVQAVPLPAGATASEFEGVGCRSATFCMAAGRYVERSGRTWALSASWDGTAWTVRTVPIPTGATRTVLLDVSCTGTARCTAVGGYTESGGIQRTFAVRWNESEWAVQTTPNPAGSENSVLQNVSCSSSTACIAVGDWRSAGTWVTLSEAWNGAEWAVESTPNRAGATFGLFEGVSCRAETCLAVGWSTEAGRDAVFGARRQAWTQETIENPRGTGVQLQEVACPTRSVCVAVGQVYPTELEGPYGAAAYRWNGSSWSFMTTPELPEDEFSGVACTSSSFCVAVGTREGDRTLAEHYNGTSWSSVTTPNPGTAPRWVKGVSCTATSACTAVGTTFTEALGPAATFAMRWNGTSWTTQTTPSPADDLNNLTAVACTSSTSCIAVGWRHTTAGVSSTLAMSWNGTSWSVQTTPTPAGATYVEPTAMSCTSSTACTAVGYYQTAEAELPFAMRWNGSTWSLQTVSLPAGATGARLKGVSCSSSTACAAVGSYVVGTLEYTLAQQWNGTSWTAELPPSPSGVESVLEAVACLPSSWCKAVGHYWAEASEAQTALAEQYVG